MSARWFAEHLRCPDCMATLIPSGDVLACACGFSTQDDTPLDLRPRRPRERTLRFAPGPAAEDELARLVIDRPAVTYHGPAAERDSSELFSAAMPWLRSGARLLDLGCGPRDQAGPAAYLGLQYAGIDIQSPRADILGDAHTIPFADATFDAVLSYAVLEHLANPFLALEEVVRVLRPGGIYFGSVSQGEPFHASYFHATPWGVIALFGHANLEIVRLWPSYDTLHALATMGKYPRVIQALIEVVHRIDRAMPFLAPRRFLRATEREKRLEDLYRAGSLCFVARKRDVSP